MKRLLTRSILSCLPLTLLATLSPSAAQREQPRRAVDVLPRVAAPNPLGGCDPPLPRMGHTVTWTRLHSPIRICADTTIPAGATVLLSQGVTLVVEEGVSLTVAGTLEGDGTRDDLLRVQGPGTLRVEGRARLRHVRMDVEVGMGPRAALRLEHATVPDGAKLTSFQRDALLDLQDTVVASGTPVWFGPVGLRGVRFLAPTSALDLGGYLLAQGVEVHGQPVTVAADHQPRLLSDLDVLGPGPNPALSITGGGITPGTNVLVDGACDLVGGTFPVRLRVGGLHPESVLPGSGSQSDAVDIGGAGAGSGVCDLPKLAIPYRADDDVLIQGRARVGAGARFLLGDFAGLEVRGNFFDDTGILRGTPEEPLLVEPLFPGAQHAGVALFNASLEHADVTGGPISSISGFNSIRECTVHDAPLGIFGDASGLGAVTGCVIRDNLLGAEDDPDSATALDFTTGRPNIFEGNLLAAQNNSGPAGVTGPFPAQDNWWGHPSGPQSPFFNPGGLGDPVGFGVEAQPWLTVRPDLDDRPPFVTLDWPFLVTDPGDVIPVTWTARDDGTIVSQRIRLDVSGGGTPQWVLLEGEIAPQRRSALVRIPFVGQTADARSSILRVEAVDDAGNVGYSEVTLQVPVLNRPDGMVQFQTDTSGGFVPGEEIAVCYDALGIASGNLRAYLVVDGEQNVLKWGPNGSAGIGACTFSPLRMPLVSTDRARLAIFSDGIGNDNDWYFSQPFSIRPHPDFSDAPPTVTLVAPLTGQRFAAGTTLPLAWTAADDEGLREFRVQASLNDGRTWHTVATVDGTARSHDLDLPPFGGVIDPVRVRVLAVDHRFQTSTDGDDRVLAIDPGV